MTEFRRFREHFRDLESRWSGTSAVPGGEGAPVPSVKLDSNENPFPPMLQPGSLLARLEANRYPDSEMTDLRGRIAEYVGADPDRVVVGNGCDELIDLTVRVAVSPGDSVVQCPPTFVMYRRFTETAGGRAVDVPLNREYEVDVQAVRAAVGERTRILFLCSPNNPTGTTVSSKTVEALSDLPVWIVADETYFEFAGETLSEWTKRSDRFVLIRSFSKGYGLAGFRVGYGVFPPDLARLLRLIRPPYSVNALAQSAALEVLKSKDRWDEAFRTILSERVRVLEALKEIPDLIPIPSRANFLFCETTSAFGARLRAFLEGDGVSIRYLSSPYSEAAFRVSIGTPEENDRFLSAVSRAAS